MAAAERPQLFLSLGDRLRREVEGDFGQMQPVALGIEFDHHRQAAAKGDIGTGGFHLHAGTTSRGRMRKPGCIRLGSPKFAGRNHSLAFLSPR